MMMKRGRVALALAAYFLAGCAYEVGELEDAEVSQRDQEIVNGSVAGSNGNAVAIYGRGTGTCTPTSNPANWPVNESNPNSYNYNNMWWPRPCSGRLIRKDGNTHYIITARHCVTVDGTMNDPDLINATTATPNLLATGRLNPGVLAVQETSNSVLTTGTPSGVLAPVYFQNFAKYWDIAMVRAVGDLQFPNAPSRRGIVAFSNDDAASFNGFSTLRTEAYGRSVPGSCYGHATSGAGILRSASGGTASSNTYKWFNHNMSASASPGTGIAGGDSGGSLWVLNIAQGWTAVRDVGVHSSPWTAAGGEGLLDFVQEALGYVFLVDLTRIQGTVVVGAPTIAGSAVTQNYAANVASTRVRYVRSSGQLQLGGLCFRDEGASQLVRVRACTSTNIGWNISVSGRIKSKTTGRCIVLDADNVSLRTATCTASSTAWTFTADNAL